MKSKHRSNLSNEKLNVQGEAYILSIKKMMKFHPEAVILWILFLDILQTS